MVFSNNLLMGAAGQATGYEIDQSVRFNDDDSAFLARTPDASNRKTWTWSAWVKRADLFNGSVPQIILSAGDGGNNDFVMQFGQSDDTLRISDYISSTQSNLITSQLFRDVSAWYHFVLAYDTTQGTAANRIKLYVSGSQVTAFGTEVYPSENQDLVINSAIAHNIGRGAYSSNGYFSGYMAEINFVDGTALAPTAFGETNDDGVWIPKAYSGAYGTEGYFIDGRDSSDLGDDESGNGNDYASSGLAAADQVTDTPTDNFCVLSPIDKNSNFTLSDGNLTNSNGTNAQAACFGTIAFDASDTDGFYWEVDCDSFASTGFAVLIADEAVNQTDISAAPTTQPAEGNLWAHRRYKDDSNGGITGVGATGSFADYGPPAVNGNVIGYCVKNGKLFIAINNTWLESGDPATEANPAFSNLTGNLRVGVNRFTDTGTDVTTLNFGQTGFTYTPPTGAKAISTANLATPTVADGSKYFQPVLYTTQTTAQDITFSGNSDLAPDWLWFKRRDGASNHFLFDKVRGVLKTISSDDANPEVTSTGSMTAFGTDGFSLGDGGSDNDINGTSGATFVAWGWAAGNSAGSSNSDGSITSTVTANTTAGFSIVKYTGTGSNATVGHGLGAVPKMILIKDTTNTESWIVYHEAVGNDGNLYLNLTNAKATQAVFQDTTPTSSVFSLGTTDGANKASGVHIAYCFAEIPAYSSFGGYTGNGSTDGPFVYTNFKPAVVMTKRTNAASDWKMWDNKRGPYNVNGVTLAANSGGAESTGTAQESDFLSNGFKIRGSDTETNGSGSTYIYMAFAENPFGGDGAAPATAR